VKKSIIIQILVCIALQGYARQDIKEIQSHYYEVTYKIFLCDDNDREMECPYYKNELTINSQESSWRGIGNYVKRVTFWYLDDPQTGVNGINVLQKVDVEVSSSYKEKHELLFNDGKLIFYYFLNEYGNEKEESRYYLKNEHLIKNIVNETDLSDEELAKVDFKKHISTAKNYQDLFLKSFK